MLKKVRGAFSQLQARLKTGEQDSSRLSEFHASELKYSRLLPQLEADVSSLEDVLGKVERELAITSIRTAARSSDVRSIACIMNAWNLCLEVQRAGCRALKSLGPVSAYGGGGGGGGGGVLFKASLARSTQHRVVTALTQALRAFKACRVVQECGLIALANFMDGRVARLEEGDARACLSDCLHSLRVCSESVRVCTAACLVLCAIVRRHPVLQKSLETAKTLDP